MVEGMIRRNSSHAPSADVHEYADGMDLGGARLGTVDSTASRSGQSNALRPVRGARHLLLMVLAALLLIWPMLGPLQANADESPSSSASSSSSASPSSSSSASSSADTGITTTDSITDTQNLLGSQVSSVSDAIAQTKSESGVTVRLLYLSTFSAGNSPEKWTSQVLESTDPPANTVLLAVASQDGNLVVAVSANSEAWLQQQSTVDELSAAALKPITEGDTPDWAASAKDMMSTIVQLQQTSTTSTTQRVGTVVFVVVLIVLLIAAAVLFVMHRRRNRRKADARRKGENPDTQEGAHSRRARRREHRRRGTPSPDDGGEGTGQSSGDAASDDDHKPSVAGDGDGEGNGSGSGAADDGDAGSGDETSTIGTDAIQDAPVRRRDRNARGKQASRRGKRSWHLPGRPGGEGNSNNNSDDIQETSSDSGQA